ncbi:MAG: glycosyltransferase [Bacteroidetes bacterium]|nr:glycosyltransferase [Bacteroidota bacterium]
MINRIKIVHIISNLSIGGAQILLFDILKNLKEHKDLDVSVITIDSGDYIKKYEDAGLNVIDIKEKGLVNPKIYFKIKKILLSIKPDIVHTHLNKADFYGRIASKRANVPLIYSTCHNYSTTHSGADITKKSVFDLIDNFVVSYSDSNLIAISEIVKKYLVNRNSKFEKITEVIYNGVDIETEKYKLNEIQIDELRRELNIRKDDFIITVAGRLEKQKGHRFFLESAGDLLKDKRNIRILILGDGNERAEIEKIITDNELSDYVRMMGFQKESGKIIEISDLICVPSLWEGFGLIIIEGMIKKKIVLASEVGGIPEIIEDSKTGFLFEAKNKEKFLRKINYIYDNFKRLDHIKSNALELVKSRFDIKKNSELYYQSYLTKINRTDK